MRTYRTFKSVRLNTCLHISPNNIDHTWHTAHFFHSELYEHECLDIYLCSLQLPMQKRKIIEQQQAVLSGKCTIYAVSDKITFFQAMLFTTFEANALLRKQVRKWIEERGQSWWCGQCSSCIHLASSPRASHFLHFWWQWLSHCCSITWVSRSCIIMHTCQNSLTLGADHSQINIFLYKHNQTLALSVNRIHLTSTQLQK